MVNSLLLNLKIIVHQKKISDDAKSTISDDTNEAEDEVVTFNISEIPMALDLGSDVEEQDFVEVVEDRREPFKELQNIMDDNPQEDVKMDFDDYQF